jgi:DNA invertase Pin-like site-specific DNA recombinase
MAKPKAVHDTKSCPCDKCVAVRAKDHEPTLIGYGRVSTDEQKTAQQIHALEQAGCTQVFTDHISGATMKRPELEKCLAALQPGDTLVIWKLDRLGRSLRNLLDIAEMLRERGVALRSLTEGFDTATSAGKMLYSVLGAVAQFERDLIQERTMLGIAAARRDGVAFGPKRKLAPAKVDAAIEMLENGKTPAVVARLLDVDRTTLWRAVKRRKDVAAAAYLL